MSTPWLRYCLAFISTCGLLTSVPAQQVLLPADQGADQGHLVTLHGTMYPLARPEYDQGAVADEFPLRRLLLMMARPADREQDLQQFLRNVHTPGSTVYHRWVSPEEFGERFGAAGEEQQGQCEGACRAWAEKWSHESSVDYVIRYGPHTSS